MVQTNLGLPCLSHSPIIPYISSAACFRGFPSAIRNAQTCSPATKVACLCLQSMVSVGDQFPKWIYVNWCNQVTVGETWFPQVDDFWRMQISQPCVHVAGFLFCFLQVHYKRLQTGQEAEWSGWMKKEVIILWWPWEVKTQQNFTKHNISQSTNSTDSVYTMYCFYTVW